MLGVALLAGCATNPRFSLDPLKNNNAVGDPLRGGNATANNNARMPGQARLMPPDAGSGPALTSGLGNEFKPQGSQTLAPSLGALAANTRPANADGSPFVAAGNAPVKPAQWSTAGAASAGFTWEQAKEQLRARGVTSFTLANENGLWTFRASVPNPQNPSLSRTYEATAGDDLSAVRQVLESVAGGR
jgi:hypothetical protein